jgi:hypothetical protein
MLRHQFGQHFILRLDLLFQIRDSFLLGLMVGAASLVESGGSVLEELLLRPAASRLLLSRFPPNSAGPSHKAAARFGSRSPRFWVPQENGAEKGDIFHVLLELRNDRRICWSRLRAALSAEQRFKIHRSFRRNTTLLEKRRRRMGLESRVASRRDISPSPG